MNYIINLKKNIETSKCGQRKIFIGNYMWVMMSNSVKQMNIKCFLNHIATHIFYIFKYHLHKHNYPNLYLWMACNYTVSNSMTGTCN